MMAVTPKSIKEDIDGLISELIGKGVCDDSNFSAIRTSGSKADVTFSGSEHVSIALGDIEYAEIYRELADKRSYNMRLVDGALLQMMYRVEGDELLQHRLAFYLRQACCHFKMIRTPICETSCLSRSFSAGSFHSPCVLILMRGGCLHRCCSSQEPSYIG